MSTGVTRSNCGGSRLPRGRETEMCCFLNFKAGPIRVTAAVCRSETAAEERRAPPVTGPHTALWGQGGQSPSPKAACLPSLNKDLGVACHTIWICWKRSAIPRERDSDSEDASARHQTSLSVRAGVFLGQPHGLVLKTRWEAPVLEKQ